MSAENELPASWATARLDEVCTINGRGFTPFVSGDDQPVAFVPMAAVVEEFGGIDVSARRPLGEVTKGYTAFVEGDVLFAKITPCMENGKVAVVPPLSTHIGFGSTEFHVLRSAGAVEPKWVGYHLSQLQFRRAARQDMTGSAGQLRVQSSWLAGACIPVAPIAEQRRAIQRIDELLSDLDAGVLELVTAKRKLSQYRQSLLKAAVEGALTAEWRERNPPQETGAELLARILRERRARWELRQLEKFAAQGKAPPKDWQRKFATPRAVDVSDSAGMRDGWTWASIDELADLGTGVTPLRSNRQFFDGGDIPWVTSGALNAERVTEPTEYVTQHAVRQCRLEVYPAGALLVAMYGEGKTRGKCAELAIDAAINQAIAALVFGGASLGCRDYVKVVLWSSYELMRQQASGGVQPNLNLQIIKGLAVPLPPLTEQIAIIETLSTQLEGLQSQEHAITHGLRLAAAQRQNILRAAFAGQLVPQDPADEPASALLARIRAERAQRPAAAKRMRRSSPQPATP